MDRPKRTCIGVVDLDLSRGQRVFEHIIFHAIEAEGTRRVEPERLEIACDHLHGAETKLSRLGKGYSGPCPQRPRRAA